MTIARARETLEKSPIWPGTAALAPNQRTLTTRRHPRRHKQTPPPTRSKTSGRVDEVRAKAEKGGR